MCDYDGTCDWDGTGRELEINPLSFDISEFDVSGKSYRRASMPWNTSLAVGTREFRRNNQRLTLECEIVDEDASRLIESWALLFPELWVPSRGFDYLKYYDDSDAEYDDMEGTYERPHENPKTLFDDTSDYLYIGSSTQVFTEIDVLIDTVAIAGTIVWEYWDGDSWEVVVVTNGDFDATAKMSWTDPGDWEKDIIAGLSSDPLYYVRANATVSPDTNPQVTFIKRHRPISCYLEISTDSKSTWGFWYRAYKTTRYYPNSFCIEGLSRVLTPGKPNYFRIRLKLVEANY